MGRFTQANPREPAYSDVKPPAQSDDDLPYEAPEAALERGVIRPVDDAPEIGANRRPSALARCGFPHLKGTR